MHDRVCRFSRIPDHSESASLAKTADHRAGEEVALSKRYPPARWSSANACVQTRRPGAGATGPRTYPGIRGGPRRPGTHKRVISGTMHMPASRLSRGGLTCFAANTGGYQEDGFEGIVKRANSFFVLSTFFSPPILARSGAGGDSGAL